MESFTTKITTTDMHTGGGPLRIVESGFPEILGETILAKRKYATENLDYLRKFLMYEPRGHLDMYGALLVSPDHPEANMGVLFTHTAGYSTMCGHALIALGRYAVDKGIVALSQPETQVNIQCPCGLVKAFVSCEGGRASSVRFHSVPAFAFALDVEVELDGFGKISVDVGYGGAFYAFVAADKFGLSCTASTAKDLNDMATRVSDAVRKVLTVTHPHSPDLAFLFGTILTDGKDSFQEDPSSNICVFGDSLLDRSPCGSGVTARLAVQYRRGLIGLNQRRVFRSVTGSEFTGRVVKETMCGDLNAITVEVTGQAFYSGSCTFSAEEADPLKGGFLLK